ncbi:hypothetical protein BHJ80_24710 (plasmid) [Escherichia coli]|nr:hypothetical protein BHJ80_24710 [Escherichia coli]
MPETKNWSSGLYVLMTKGIRKLPAAWREFATIPAVINADGMYCPECVRKLTVDGVIPPSDVFSPSFADIFQQGNRWLNWLRRSQPADEPFGTLCAGRDEIGLVLQQPNGQNPR